MVEPTAEESAAFTDLNSVADWAGLRHRAATTDAAEFSPRGTLLSRLGMTGSEPVRSLGYIPEADYTVLLGEWLIAGAAPSPAARAQAGLFGQAARIASGAQVRLADRLTIEAETRRLSTLQAQMVLSAPTTLPPVGPPPVVPMTSKIKMSTIVDQANDNEVQIMPQLQVSEAYDTYRAKLGDFPRPEEDVTPEQLSGLHELYKSKSALYVDLAV